MTVYVCFYFQRVCAYPWFYAGRERARDRESGRTDVYRHYVPFLFLLLPAPARTCTISRHTDRLMSAKLLNKLGTQLSHLGMIANTCTIIVKSTDWGGRRMVRCRSGSWVSGLLRLESQIQVTCRGAVKLMCGSSCIHSKL